MVTTLILVPTQMELDCLSDRFQKGIEENNGRIELCGFGVVVSGIRATQLIAEFAPKRVLLIGIAGALSPELQVGDAVEFGEAVCYGIGTGSGDAFISASEMGWKQWPGGTEIADSIHLADDGQMNGNCLLTCCSASATKFDARLRLEKYPTAVAEDMEGFSVAVACRFAGIPLRIIRGISNFAGDRNKNNWRLRDAMLAVEKTISDEAWI